MTSRRGFLSALLGLAGVGLVGVGSAEAGQEKLELWRLTGNRPYHCYHPPAYRDRYGNWHCNSCKLMGHSTNYGMSAKGLRGIVDNGTVMSPISNRSVRNLTEADIVQYYKDTRPYNWRQWTKRYRRG